MHIAESEEDEEWVQAPLQTMASITRNSYLLGMSIQRKDMHP